MDEDTRRCALPGCDAVIEPTPGRPERRYCTAAHRAAARQARRASAQAPPESRLAEALPWVAEHETAPPPARPPLPAGAAPRPAERRSAAVAPSPPRPARPRPGGPGRMTASLPRRKRALAVLGAAGILAGGYAVTARESLPAPVAPAQSAVAGNESQWAARAEIALASVTRQLDTIADVEAAWNNMPASMRAGAPAEVRALQERKDVLERRRLILRSQLDTFQQRQEVQTELRAAEQRLRDVERQLQDVPPPGRRSPQQQAEIAVLEEQRALQAQRRDAKAVELAGLTEGVENAARVPLPDDSAKTAAVSEDVREVIEGGGEPSAPGDVQPPRPDLVGGRDQDGERPRAEAHTSAPPDPRGPGDESRGREGGPVETVTDTVGGVAGALTGARSGSDGDRDKDRDKDDKDKDRGKDEGKDEGKGKDEDGAGARGDRGGDSGGGVQKVGDTVDDTAAGLTGVLGGGSEDDRDRGSGGGPRGEERRAAPASAGADRVEDGVGIAPAAQERSAPRVQPAPRVLPAPAPALSPSTAPPSAAQPSPFGPAAVAPSSGKRISPEEAAMARAVVASVPGGQFAAPALEAAIAQQERADAAAGGAGSGSDSGSSYSASDSSDSARDADSGDSGSGDSGSGDSGSGDSGSGDSGWSDSGWSDSGSSDSGSSDRVSSDSGESDSDLWDSVASDSGSSDSDSSDSDSSDSDSSDSDSDSESSDSGWSDSH